MEEKILAILKSYFEDFALDWRSDTICLIDDYIELEPLAEKISDGIQKNNSIKVRVCCSGGFDPIHPGHISYIEEALKLGDEFLVILSRDDQLFMKKHKQPILYEVRKAVLEWGLKGRGKVVKNIDKDITSRESLRLYRPNIYAKGGNTWNMENLPEKEVCQELGIKVVFGVGGFEKIWSSSQLQ